MVYCIISLAAVALLMYFVKKETAGTKSDWYQLNTRLDNLIKTLPADPHKCSTHGHVMGAVYDVSSGTELSENKIAALSEAARRNSESIESLLEIATKSENSVYIQHVCKYCGLVVKRDGSSSSRTEED